LIRRHAVKGLPDRCARQWPSAQRICSADSCAKRGLTRYRVEDWSTAPDYNRGDIVFGFRDDHPHPKFGDTVVYVATNSPGKQIGRVAGVPGDRVVVDFGRVYIN
jgi:hypothetical protein